MKGFGLYSKCYWKILILKAFIQGHGLWGQEEDTRIWMRSSLAIVWRVDERGPKRNIRRMLLRGLVMIAG